jgi:hypothetical protein
MRNLALAAVAPAAFAVIARRRRAVTAAPAGEPDSAAEPDSVAPAEPIPQAVSTERREEAKSSR